MMQIEVDAQRVSFAEEGYQVLQRPPELVHAPRGDDIKLAPRRILA
jgi:hypothetical protein